MTITWEQAFGPVARSKGWAIREGQALLGQAIIETIENNGALIGEAPVGSGKSMAILVPMILKAQEFKAKKTHFRGVVSTETITLMDQIVGKDLPELAKLYHEFTYRKLMGRSNYVCLEYAKTQIIGDARFNQVFKKLEMRKDNLGDGELADVERVLGREVLPEEWEKMSGSADFCGDNSCKEENCFSTRARSKALKADIVVTNHALVATDAEMKATGSEDGLLGPIDVLAVDEFHSLEPVLVEQYTKKFSEYDLEKIMADIMDGIDWAKGLEHNDEIGPAVSFALDGMWDLLENVKKFYRLLVEANPKEKGWAGSSTALALQYFPGMPEPAMYTAMVEFEEENPQRLQDVIVALEAAIKYMTPVAARANEEKIKGRKKLNKGLTAAHNMLEIANITAQALTTKDGIIDNFGAYGARVDGWEKRDGTPGMTIFLTPLDVSVKAKNIWRDVSAVIGVSGTLQDFTDRSLRYAKESVGFPPCREVKVPTAFDYQKQQLVYVTRAMGERVEGAQYDFSELVQLLEISDGRALVLFTARKELEYAAASLRALQAQGKFNHLILVQEKDSDKKKLAKIFKEDKHSILLGLKSFFTGFDAPDETLSLLAICKFPLPRYSVENRQRMKHWKKKGFPKWYEREALTVFQQGAGRLIRSSTDKGVVALLDFRAMDISDNVYKTASMGVQSLGSPVTQDLNAVRTFLS